MPALAIVLLLAATPAEANVVRGVSKIVSGVLALPMSALAGTFGGPLIIGTVLGAASGLFQGAGMVASGALDVALGGVSLVPAFLPFLF